MTQTEILWNTKLEAQNDLNHYNKLLKEVKMKQTRDKLQSLHSFISYKQNSQDLMMLGFQAESCPK